MFSAYQREMGRFLSRPCTGRGYRQSDVDFTA